VHPLLGCGLGVPRWLHLKPCNPETLQAEARLSATIPQRIEPKTFFANERTFLSWLHMAVTIGSIGAALLGFSGSAPRNPHASTTVRHVTLAALSVPPNTQHSMCCWAPTGPRPGACVAPPPRGRQTSLYRAFGAAVACCGEDLPVCSLGCLLCTSASCHRARALLTTSQHTRGFMALVFSDCDAIPVGLQPSAMTRLFVAVAHALIAAYILQGTTANNRHTATLQGVGDTTDIIAMILLPVAVLMCAYALVVFLWRSGQIARKQVRLCDCD
jgi:uncharacterized membrane protein YidH (DUF202 family)